MTLPTIAVTGATGFLGGAVARELHRAGIPQRVLVRNPVKAPRLEGVVALPFSFADREASVRALAGVELLFMVSASENAERLAEHRNFVDAAREAGVRHIVYTSFLGAAPYATFTLARDHYFTEQHIRASGMAHTFLRDALYLDFVPELVGKDGVIRGPAHGGRAAIVSRADVARVASTVLRNPAAHVGATYNLTGPEALTMTEIAAIVSRARGTTIAYHDETIAEAYESRAKWGAPDWQVDAWVSTYTAIAAGDLSVVSGDVERVTGRRPISLAEFLLRP